VRPLGSKSSKLGRSAPWKVTSIPLGNSVDSRTSVSTPTATLRGGPCPASFLRKSRSAGRSLMLSSIPEGASSSGLRREAGLPDFKVCNKLSSREPRGRDGIKEKRENGSHAADQMQPAAGQGINPSTFIDGNSKINALSTSLQALLSKFEESKRKATRMPPRSWCSTSWPTTPPTSMPSAGRRAT
jgi:hypothetical protein